MPTFTHINSSLMWINVKIYLHNWNKSWKSRHHSISHMHFVISNWNMWKPTLILLKMMMEWWNWNIPHCDVVEWRKGKTLWFNTSYLAAPSQTPKLRFFCEQTFLARTYLWFPPLIATRNNLFIALVGWWSGYWGSKPVKKGTTCLNSLLWELIFI